MIFRPNPWFPVWPPLIVPPDPEVLIKYGKAAMMAARVLRNKAKAKGKEHRERLADKGIWQA
jgi:hypothetical protein